MGAMLTTPKRNRNERYDTAVIDVRTQETPPRTSKVAIVARPRPIMYPDKRFDSPGDVLDEHGLCQRLHECETVKTNRLSAPMCG